MPKLVPFVLRLNGTSNIDIASQGWSHLITKCGTRVYARVAGEGIRLRRHSKWREEIDIEPNYLRGVVRMPSLNGEGEEKKVVKPLPL